MFFFFWGPLFFFFPLFFLFVILRWIFPRLGRQVRLHDPFSFGNSLTDMDSRGARIFRLAQRLGGRVTLSDIVIETGMDPKQAEKFIESLVDGVRVRMEVDEKGIVYYEFPEILARLRDR
ncbi:MAG: hypothetical protein SNJ78_10900 [Spirochaetales bacterium]